MVLVKIKDYHDQAEHLFLKINLPNSYAIHCHYSIGAKIIIHLIIVKFTFIFVL